MASGSNRGSVVLIGLILIGAAVSVALGAYGKAHDPTGTPLFDIGSWTMLETKTVLASITMALALVQVATAVAMYRGVARVATVHRVSGVAAVAFSIPVAMQCLWALGFDDYNTRVLLHSLAGCVFYGVFVTKMLALRSDSVPRWAVPALGGTLFTVLVAVWVTSAGWYLAQ